MNTRTGFRISIAFLMGAAIFSPLSSFAQAKPTGLSPNNNELVKPGVVRLKWQPVSGARHYRIRLTQFESPGGKKIKDIEESAGRSTEGKTLRPGYYEWTVVAHMRDGSTSFSSDKGKFYVGIPSTAQPKVPGSAPNQAKPTNLRPNNNEIVKPGVVRLQWKSIPGARQYRIRLTQFEFRGGRKIKDIEESAGRTTEGKTLQAGYYEWSVVALMRDGSTSDPSDKGSFHVSTPATTKPVKKPAVVAGQPTKSPSTRAPGAPSKTKRGIRPAQRVRGGSASKLSAAQRQEMVHFHNKVRAEVGLKPVSWSEKLAVSAQQYAETLARTGDIKHSDVPGGPGENLAMGKGGGYQPINGAQAWYAEKKNFKRGTLIPGPNFMQYGHYTQMVWDTTTQIGVGVATIQRGRMKGGLVIVAHYNPAGNITGRTPY